jgi:hypothetical protein
MGVSYMPCLLTSAAGVESKVEESEQSGTR